MVDVERAFATSRLYEAISQVPGRRVRELAASFGLDKSLCNSILYSRRDLFLSPDPPTRLRVDWRVSAKNAL